MKRTLAAIAALCLALAFTPAHAQTTGLTTGTATTINVTWTPVPATTGLTITGYTATISSPAGNTVTVPVCSSTVTANCIQPGASTASFTWSPGGALYYGSWGISVATNATNSAGAALTSTPATTTVVYAPAAVTTVPAPGGLTVQFTTSAAGTTAN